MRRFLEWSIHETGLHSLMVVRSRDVWLILLSRFLRMVAFGMAALVMAIYLWLSFERGTRVGTFLTMALLGSAVISYILTIYADRIGRRRVIMGGSCMMVIAGIVFFSTSNYYVLLFAAIIGIITPGAHEVGPFRALQEAILAQLSPIEARTDIYAWFAVSSTFGMAVGLCIAGWVTWLVRKANPDIDWHKDWRNPKPYPYVFLGYAVFGLLKVIVTFFLTERCEADYVPSQEEVTDSVESRETTAPLLGQGDRLNSYVGKPTAGRITTLRRRFTDPISAKVSPANKGVLIRLSVLFAINSFAQGLLPVTLMSWYLNWRGRWFLTSRIGYAMSLVWLLASVANLCSASVARRIGLIKAMVLVHLPNAIFLAFIPLAKENWIVVVILLIIASVLGSMDQAPRMAFVAAVFNPDERVSVMGTLNLVRTVASAAAPLLTGYFHDQKWWFATFYTSAALRILYDIGLLAMFLKTKLPEHGRDGQVRQVTVADVDPGILLSENFRHPEEFEEPFEEAETGDLGQNRFNTPIKRHYEHIEEV